MVLTNQSTSGAYYMIINSVQNNLKILGLIGKYIGPGTEFRVGDGLREICFTSP